MKFYKIDDQIIISDKALTVGTELMANTVDPATNTIRYFCRNFNNPLGTGTSTPIEIGSIEYKKMFINFWITAIGGKNMRTRKLEYTIWKEK